MYTCNMVPYTYALVLLESGNMYIKDINSQEKLDIWCDDVATPSPDWQWSEGKGKMQPVIAEARVMEGGNFRCKEWRIVSTVPALDIKKTDSKVDLVRFHHFKTIHEK